MKEQLQGYCYVCHKHTFWRKVTGHVFHVYVQHERCNVCHAAVGVTAKAAWMDDLRQRGRKYVILSLPRKV